MWWSKPKSDFDAVAHLRGTIAQGKAIMEAEHAGRKAWRLSVVNAMLAESYRGAPRQYRWSRSELSQLAGVEIQTVSERDAEYDRP